MSDYMAREYWNLNMDQWLEVYERHNPGCLRSLDPNERRFGKCGCLGCAEMRQIYKWAEMPMNAQGRKTNQMSSINMCDRCGALVQGEAVGAVTLVTGSNVRAERMHKEICPGCVAALLALLEAAATPSQQAYKEPWKRPQPAPKGMGELQDVDTEVLLATVMERQMKTRAIEGTSKEA